MLPTLTDPARASRYRSLELKLEKALCEVASLRIEVAELKERLASVGDQGSGNLVDVSGGPAKSPANRPANRPAANAKRGEPNFDWDEWARETKARIRGEESRSA